MCVSSGLRDRLPYWKRWAGQRLTTGSSGKIPICDVCPFHGVNIPSMADSRYQHDVTELGVGKECAQLALRSPMQASPSLPLFHSYFIYR